MGKNFFRVACARAFRFVGVEIRFLQVDGDRVAAATRRRVFTLGEKNFSEVGGGSVSFVLLRPLCFVVALTLEVAGVGRGGALRRSASFFALRAFAHVLVSLNDGNGVGDASAMCLGATRER